MEMGNSSPPEPPVSPARNEVASPTGAGSSAAVTEIMGEEKYRLLFDRMLNGVALCETITGPAGETVDLRYLEVNPAFERITGVRGADAVGRTIRELFPDIECHWIETFGKVASTGEAASFTAHFKHHDKHLDIRAFSPMFGQLAIIFEDITRRVQVEQTLRESEIREKARAAELAALMEAVPATVLIAHDPQCRRITGNLAACELLRMPPGGNLSKSAPYGERPVHYRIFRNGVETPPDELPVQRAARGEEVRDYEEEFVFDDGSSRTLLGNATPLRDEMGRLCGAVSTFVDITERKTMERALAESEDLFRTLCDSAPIGIFRTDLEGNTTYLNPVWEKISGIPVAEGLGQGWRKGIHPDDWKSLSDAWKRATEAGGIVDVEHRKLTPQGKTVWARVLASPIKGKDGKVTGYMGTVEDVTELRHFREEIQKGQKLESLGVLAGGIAHDFNNILTTILGNISLARMQLHDGEKIAKRLVEVENAAARAKELSRQLLTFARGGEPVKKPVAVGELLKEAAGFALRGTPVRCEFVMEENLPQVEADEGQLGQVLHNLVINAVQSMPDGGAVTIGAKNAGQHKDGYGSVVISVADTGTGIPEQHLQRIFDPYFTTKQQGSGLGLATCYSIIKKHGGSITVESTLGKGSTFYVTLPASEPARKIEEESAGDCGHLPVRVLVMDDEEPVREILQDMLEELGYISECTENGAEAVELYRARKAEGTPFSVVILDLTIPGGVGGREAIKSLLEIDPDVNAVVSSGYSTDPIMATYREHGFRAVLGKPYRLQDMEKVFQELQSSRPSNNHMQNSPC